VGVGVWVDGYSERHHEEYTHLLISVDVCRMKSCVKRDEINGKIRMLPITDGLGLRISLHGFHGFHY